MTSQTEPTARRSARWLHIPGAVLLVLAYAAYARWTLRHSGEVKSEEELRPLIIWSFQVQNGPAGLVLVAPQAGGRREHFA